MTDGPAPIVDLLITGRPSASGQRRALRAPSFRASAERVSSAGFAIIFLLALLTHAPPLPSGDSFRCVGTKGIA